MTETELLPCPFCNSDPLLIQHAGYAAVECACGAETRHRVHPGIFKDWRSTEAAEKRGAVKKWNTRPSTRASVSEAAVTDEMVDRAIAANTEAKLLGGEPRDWVRAALSAALASTAETMEPEPMAHAEERDDG